MKDKILKSGFGIGNIIFIAALIIALPLRIYQYTAGIIEPRTGFFASDDPSVYALWAVIAVAAAAIILFGFMKRKTLDYNLEKVKRPGIGALSGLFAASLIIDAVSCLDAIGGIDLGLSASETTPERTSYYIILLQMIFALISALYFVILCVGMLTGKTTAEEFRIVSLAPVFWNIFRMVSRFMRTISYIRVSELLFEMIMLMFMIIFFMSFAQCNSRVNDKDCKWKLGAYGLPAALLALLCFVPRFILTLAGKAEMIYSQSVIEYADCAAALFIIGTVLTRVCVKQPEAEAEEEAPDTPDEATTDTEE